MKRRLFALLLTLPMALALAAAPAQADPTCPEGNLCFWTGYSYTGARHLIGPREIVPPGACALIDPNNTARIPFRSFKNQLRGVVFAPAWPTPVGNRPCTYEKILRYGEGIPRLFPIRNMPDSVRHYFRL